MTDHFAIAPLGALDLDRAAALHAESFAAAKLLIDAGADVRAKRTKPVEVMLSRSVIGGDRRTIDFLIASGAAKERKTAYAALRTAAVGGKTGVVELLLAQRLAG